MTSPDRPSPDGAKGDDSLPPVAPDFVEQDHADDFGNIIPATAMK
jgi:hypothetical protein